MAKRINYAALPHIEHELSDGAILGLALPLELAPTLNMYAKLAQQKGRKWKLATIHRALAARVGVARLACRCMVMANPCRRRVVATRHSSTEPDGGVDVQVYGEMVRFCDPDVIGAKMILDQFVKQQVLVDDNSQWLERDGRWVKAPPRKGKLVVEVFECEEPTP